MKAKIYETPIVEIVEVTLERGIAQSGAQPNGSIADFGENPAEELW